ncbi:SWI/SNF-related matrix-associated actin-dependent regulator of chromatin subfamily A containing DEAD/H box 1-like [Elysia marginata]|uniref:DNA helicase n=1 Tax=Elysia marginata TaxID=1093978 RepID=A0AAV4ES12_9GAST|nr:SWI/SNF-related matrix-associated actin-dependent regulator of chromatin subfamily A containing DEAD/H box 1-like [Elysia marginata]
MVTIPTASLPIDAAKLPPSCIIHLIKRRSLSACEETATMSGPSGSINSLLKYRFVRKPSSQLSPPDSQNASLARENSDKSVDSQATVPYGSQELDDSQATLPYQQESSQDTLPPPQANQGDGPTHPASPVFNSKKAPVSNQIITIDSDHNCDSPTAAPTSGPWISKETGVKTQTKTNGKSTEPVKFRRIQRPGSDSEDESPKKELTSFERLKELFPDGSENRMRAALILHPNNFQEAVKFVANDCVPPTSGKRPAPERSLEEARPAYKRIKPMPESPSPTGPKVMSVDYLKEYEAKKKEKEAFQKGLEFLRGCFPALTADQISQVLKAENGDTDAAAEALTKTLEEETQRKAEICSKGVSNGSSSNPASTSLLKNNLTGNKIHVKKKRARDDDMSEDEDEYDDFDGSDDSDDSEDLDNRSQSETDNFLHFFEEATIEELTAMPGCSKKKAELIISLRPYKTWEHLIEAFTSQKQLSTSLISGCKEIMQVRNTIRRLMMRCENISQQMGLVVSRLTAGDRGGDGDMRITKQPEVLNKEFELQPYQLIGLSWLRIMHQQELNGILADEMGLGKTIQAISFIAHLMEEGEEGPHVIIVPSSTIENWLRELQRWCPSLKVIVYYGSQDERRAVRHSIFFQGEEFNVLLTTYNMATGGVEDRVLFKKFDFHYAVFDEGHMLKNMSSMRFQNLMKISAERRLLLTGTPLQNNLLELMSLLCFVMPEIFQGKTDHLKKVFAMITRSSDEKQKSRFERDRIAQAKRIMKPFILRRLKKDVLQHLPKKTETIERCSMTPSQQELYDRLVTKYSLEISENTSEDGEGNNTAGGGIGIFMQFRKVANHPLLLRNLFKDGKLRKMAKAIAKEPSHRERGALPDLIQEDMSVMNDFELMGLCKQYPNDRVLLFSQFTMMLDIAELYLEQNGHKFIRLDGQTPVPDRLQLIDRFNSEPDIFVFLLSTRAGGLGINLCAANTIILHDIDFNPYNDKQAEDRCHRLGQKREVKIHKLICECTVDEAMLDCANGKLALEQDLTRPEGEEGAEENSKDVVKLLKEVLRLRQKGSTAISSSAALDAENDEDDEDEDEEDDGVI